MGRNGHPGATDATGAQQWWSSRSSSHCSWHWSSGSSTTGCGSTTRSRCARGCVRPRARPPCRPRSPAAAPSPGWRRSRAAPSRCRSPAAAPPTRGSFPRSPRRGPPTTAWTKGDLVVVCVAVKAKSFTGFVPLPTGGVIQSKTVMSIENGTAPNPVNYTGGHRPVRAGLVMVSVRMRVRLLGRTLSGDRRRRDHHRPPHVGRPHRAGVDRRRARARPGHPPPGAERGRRRGAGRRQLADVGWHHDDGRSRPRRTWRAKNFGTTAADWASCTDPSRLSYVAAGDTPCISFNSSSSPTAGAGAGAVPARRRPRSVACSGARTSTSRRSPWSG